MDEWDDTARDQVSLHPAVVIVLYDWLVSVDMDALPVSHATQKQALTDLLTAIELDTRAPYASDADIARARERVAREWTR